MVTFKRIAGSQLFGAEQHPDDAGWFGLVLPQAVDTDLTELTFETALANSTLGASFVFTLRAPELSADNTAQMFATQIQQLVVAGVGNRSFIWLQGLDWNADFTTISSLSPPPPHMPIAASGANVISKLTVTLCKSGHLQFIVMSGDKLAADNELDRLLITNPQAATQLLGAAAPTHSASATAVIELSGANMGRIQTDMSLQRSDMLDDLGWGFEYYAPLTRQPPFEYQLTYAPLASGQDPRPSDRLAFRVRIDPRDPNNRLDPEQTATAFFFSQDAVLKSFFRTNFGQEIELAPIILSAATDDTRAARFVVSPGELSQGRVRDFSFAPAGDFVMRIDEAQNQTSARFLQCALSGVESIGFLPPSAGFAYHLRFTAGMPAVAPIFPILDSSPVGTPIDVLAPLLTGPYFTSWMTVVAIGTAQTAPYVAQPKGAHLFGKSRPQSAAASDSDGVLDPADPAVSLSDAPFPMIPYAGVAPSTIDDAMSAQEIEQLEQQILSPTRRSIIGDSATASHLSARQLLDAATGTDTGVTAGSISLATPSGLIASLDAEDGRWNNLVLGRNFQPSQRTMSFLQPDDRLKQAFQTSSLFLVATNATHLGVLQDSIDATHPGDAPTFNNVMNVDDWVMAAAVGTGNAYNDYRNVLIVKGSRGKLVDLVRSPDKWTQKRDFAAPLVTDNNGTSTTDDSQLVIVSQWISDYLAAAQTQTDEYFENFNRIANDPNWTGILVLKADIAQIPGDLAGITQGIDTEQFFAHHFGINISPVDPAEVDITESSAVFGLIHYVDPAFNDQAESPLPVTPPAGADWDFKVLSLKTLFENTSVKRFESWAQVTLNTLFADQVLSMTVLDGNGLGIDQGNNFNSLLLRGAYQNNSGTPVYSLASVNAGIFRMRSDVLHRVEISTAQMSTLDDGLQSGQVVSWIGMSGYMNFADIGQSEDAPFDVFSYGSDIVADSPGQGLAFRQLGLRLSHPLVEPEQGSIELISADLAFDQGGSRVRARSLVRNFSLNVREFIASPASTSPAELGYLGVIANSGLSGLGSGAWNGLVLRVNLGTPGALAGKVGLNSDLLLAWAAGTAAPDDRVSNDGTGPDARSYKAEIGLSLPGSAGGAPLISLQTVMKLSVGLIRLLYVDQSSDGGQTGFLLLLTDIALKFLGLLKIPPNGSTAFYLFGNEATNSTDDDGVGWYAVYNQDQPEPDQ